MKNDAKHSVHLNLQGSVKCHAVSYLLKASQKRTIRNVRRIRNSGANVCDATRTVFETKDQIGAAHFPACGLFSPNICINIVLFNARWFDSRKHEIGFQLS